MTINDKLLTFELSADSDEIEVHCDLNGLTELIQVLERLKKTGEHEHLMTPAWGGNELSEEIQGEKTKLINKATFHLWDKNGR